VSLRLFPDSSSEKISMAAASFVSRARGRNRKDAASSRRIAGVDMVRLAVMQRRLQT
jgi:hypothetical protein